MTFTARHPYLMPGQRVADASAVELSDVLMALRAEIPAGLR